MVLLFQATRQFQDCGYRQAPEDQKVQTSGGLEGLWPRGAPRKRLIAENVEGAATFVVGKPIVTMQVIIQKF